MLEEYKNDRAIWEENADSVNLRSDILVTNRIVDILGDIEGKTILDLGCGNGKLARKLSMKGARVVGIDITPEQIEFAKQREEKERMGIQYFVCDLTHINSLVLPIKEFDIVISAMTHLYLSEKEFVRSFSVISSYLKQGGHFIYGDIHPSRTAEIAGRDQLIKAELPTVTGKIFKTTFFSHSRESLFRSLHEAGFYIHQAYEPVPTEEERQQYKTLFRSIEHTSPYMILDTSIH